MVLEAKRGNVRSISQYALAHPVEAHLSAGKKVHKSAMCPEPLSPVSVPKQLTTLDPFMVLSRSECQE